MHILMILEVLYQNLSNFGSWQRSLSITFNSEFGSCRHPALSLVHQC